MPLPDPTIEFHPLLDELPMMDDVQFGTFCEDVRQAGRFHEPIVLLDGKILGGRHRHLAGLVTAIEPHFRDFDLHADGDPCDWVVSQLARRERDASMKAVEVVLLAERMPKAVDGQGETLDRLCARVGVNTRYAAVARACRNTAPSLWRGLADGKLKIPVAERQMQRTAKVKSWAATAPVDDSIALTDETCRILVGDCREQLDANVRDASVDLIFADGPYGIGEDYHDFDDRLTMDKLQGLYASALYEGIRVLKPTGSLWLMLPSRLSSFGLSVAQNAGFTPRDTIIWAESFGQHNAKYFTDSYRVIHHLVVDDDHFTFNADDARAHVPSVRAESNDPRAAAPLKLPGNVWGVWTDRKVARLVDNAAERVPVDQVKAPNQLPVALVERIVLLASNPGDVVLDPFHGTGTTAVASLLHGRKYIGCELSPEVAEASRGWIRARLALFANKEPK